MGTVLEATNHTLRLRARTRTMGAPAEAFGVRSSALKGAGRRDGAGAVLWRAGGHGGGRGRASLHFLPFPPLFSPLSRSAQARAAAAVATRRTPEPEGRGLRAGARPW